MQCIVCNIICYVGELRVVDMKRLWVFLFVCFLFSLSISQSLPSPHCLFCKLYWHHSTFKLVEEKQKQKHILSRRYRHLLFIMSQNNSQSKVLMENTCNRCFFHFFNSSYFDICFISKECVGWWRDWREREEKTGLNRVDFRWKNF